MWAYGVTAVRVASDPCHGVTSRPEADSDVRTARLVKLYGQVRTVSRSIVDDARGSQLMSAQSARSYSGSHTQLAISSSSIASHKSYTVVILQSDYFYFDAYSD